MSNAPVGVELLFRPGKALISDGWAHLTIPSSSLPPVQRVPQFAQATLPLNHFWEADPTQPLVLSGLHTALMADDDIPVGLLFFASSQCWREYGRQD